ncbi:MAG: phage virion morphogenesis protein [Christiangramia sp.]|uniref:phage virion morphogenesis protein n=1 Tax=Christiangramia sp. TaxID=1931228 RepID=UPI0032424C8B
MAQDMRQLQKLLRRGMRVMPDKLPRIIEGEGLRFISKNFRDQGFNDSGLRKWKRRRKRDASRALLVGENTGGDKLKNSFRAVRRSNQVRFITYKPYAKIHNEGGRIKGTFNVRSHKRRNRKTGKIQTVSSHKRTVDTEIPQRQFMGKSAYLDKQIKKKLTKELDKLFK